MKLKRQKQICDDTVKSTLSVFSEMAMFEEEGSPLSREREGRDGLADPEGFHDLRMFTVPLPRFLPLIMVLLNINVANLYSLSQ